MHGADAQTWSTSGPIPDVPRVSIMEDLTITLEGLAHNLTLLEQRLGSVSRPEYSEPSASDPNVKPVASPIREFHDALARQMQRVGNLLDRLEV